MEEEYILTSWDNFTGHLQVVFRELYEDDKYADVTLVCDDQIQFKAHRIVLNACSSVFKKIIDNNPSQHPLIYLRGIQHQEMESILQFMYLGEGKFYHQRMTEFLRVAADLEVKDIGKNVEIMKNEAAEHMRAKDIEKNAEIKIEDVRQTEEKNDEDILSQHNLTRAQSNTVPTDCPECGDVFSRKSQMLKHFRSKHEGEGIKYTCPQCDYQAGRRDNLKYHIQSKHEGVRYNCNKCDYQALRQDVLRKHIQSRHEGVKYPCNQCEHKASERGNLVKHIQSEHEGVTYPCNQCSFQAKHKSNLKSHIKSKH